MKLVSGLLIAILLGANAYGRQYEGAIDQSSLSAELESGFTAGSVHSPDGTQSQAAKRARAKEFIETVFAEGEELPQRPASKTATATGR